jgi:hypothetical protein
MKNDKNVQRTSIVPFGVYSSEGADKTGLTIYSSGGLAVVRETRRVSLIAGPNQVYLEGLPAQYQLNSLVVVDYAGEGELSLGPVSYRAANLDKNRVLQGSIGKPVTVSLAQNNGRIVNVGGTLRAVLGNELAVERSDNKRLMLVPSSQVELKELPAGLSSTPSLMMLPTATADGDYDVSLLYEAGGLGWSARYFAFYDEKTNKLSRLEASVAITNRSGARFHNALVQLIAASNYAQADSYGLESAGGGMRMMSAAPMAKRSLAARAANVESVGEVKMYPLGERVTIADGETQQVTLFLAKDVPVKREFYLDAGSYDSTPGQDAQKLPVYVRLRMENNAESNLGSAMPDGEVSILQPDSSGNPQKTFTARLDAVTQGESFKLEFGPTADIKAERVLLSASETEEEGAEEEALSVSAPKRHGAEEDATETETPRFREEERQLTVFNYKGEAVDVLVSDNIPEGAEFISKPEGHEFAENGVNGADVRVRVPANGKTTLQYRLRWQLN